MKKNLRGAMDMTSNFPKMLEMRQTYPTSKQLDFPRLLHRAGYKANLCRKIKPRMRLAVGVAAAASPRSRKL
jgi:hypothetical protein